MEQVPNLESANPAKATHPQAASSRKVQHTASPAAAATPTAAAATTPTAAAAGTADPADLESATPVPPQEPAGCLSCPPILRVIGAGCVAVVAFAGMGTEQYPPSPSIPLGWS